MSNIGKMVSATLAGAVLSGAALAADTGVASTGGFLAQTKPLIDVRLRAEGVDQDPLPEDARAVTLRARLGFETGKIAQTSLLAEGEFVVPLQTDYRSDPAIPLPGRTAPSLTRYPVVADPEAYELNRLHLTNTSLPGTTIILGRQRIALDDHRFVGNVGWRQNEQTYDALRVVNKSVPKLTIDATYLNQVNRVYGPDSPQGRYHGDGYLGNIAYQLPVGKLTGFAYVLDFDAITSIAPALNPSLVSTATYGVRFAGEKPISKVKLAYIASYATQADYGDNPADFTDDYYMAELTATYAQFSAGVGTEVLQGNGSVGFATPLATLHRFQGWADKFLTTPANGINDQYATLGYAMKALGPLETFSATVQYHEFTSERRDFSYGDEVDAQLQGKWQRIVATLKYADYHAGKSTPLTVRDTSKYWVQVDFVW